MKKQCPLCHEEITAESPGVFLCRNCGNPVEISPLEFEWTAPTHIDELSPAGNIAEKDEDRQQNTVSDSDSASGPKRESCAVCGMRPAVRACPRCGRAVCDECSETGHDSHPICRDCAGPSTPFVPVSEDTNPGKFFIDFIPKTKEILFHPNDFFSRLSPDGKIWPAVLFGIIISLPGGAVEIVSNILLQPEIFKTLSQFIDIPNSYPTDFTSVFTVFSIVGAMLVLPFSILFSIFISSAITHVLLLILGGVKGRFEDTIRVIAYSNASSLFKILPGLGSMVGYVWGIALNVIGLSKVHKIPTWKPLVALLAPLFLCCCSVFFLVLAISGILAANI